MAKPPEPAPQPAGFPPAAGQYISTLEASRILGVSTFSVQRWFDEGLLTGARMPGGHRRITSESLRAFMQKHGLLPQGTAEGDGSRVLLIGNDAKLVGAMKDFLAGTGQHLVSTATSGLDAGLALSETRPDAVVLDLDLEDIPGPTQVQRLRASSLGRSLRIVAVTGKASAAEQHDLKKAGAAAVLTKPFPMHDLVKALRLHVAPSKS